MTAESPVDGGGADAEDVADLRDGHRLLLVEPARGAHLVHGEPRRTATGPAAGSGGGKAGVRAFLAEVPFELRQCGEDVEHEPPAGRGGVDGLLQRAEPAAALGEGVQVVDEVPDGATLPIEPPDDEGVAGAELVEELVELGRVSERAGDGVDEHAAAADGVEHIDLQRRVLVGGGHARVPEEVTREENGAKLDRPAR